MGEPMVEFVIRGTFSGERVEITWSDGRLRGPHEVVDAVRHLASEREGEAISPAGTTQPYSVHNHLMDPHSARVLVERALDDDPVPELEVTSGRFPPPPPYRDRRDALY